MKLRSLGRTGLAVSEIGFGCGPTAGLMIRGTPKERRDAIAHAIELGVNYIDTAPIYGDTVSEANLGQALRELDASPIVATKVALGFDDLADIRGAVIRSVEASLERLGMKRLSLVQLHNRVGERRAAKPDIGTGALLTVDDVLGPGGVVDALRALRAKGVIEFFGCCAFGGETASVNRLIDSGAFDTMLVHYSVLNSSAWIKPAPQAPMRDYGQVGARAASTGMGIIALRVLEGGALAGDVRRHPLAGAPIGADYGAMVRRGETLRRLSDGEGQALAETAVRFALTNAAVATVLIGFSDMAQIDDAARYAGKGPLSEAALSRIEDMRQADFSA